MSTKVSKDNEKLINNVYKYLDVYSDESALNASEKLVKSYPKCLLGLPLLCLSLNRVGRKREARELYRKLLKDDQVCLDSRAGQVLCNCLRESTDYEGYVYYYVKLSSKSDNREDKLGSIITVDELDRMRRSDEIMTNRFTAYARIAQFKNQRSVAMTLTKQISNESIFSHWLCASTYLEGAYCVDANLAAKMLMPLADRMLEKIPQTDSARAELTLLQSACKKLTDVVADPSLSQLLQPVGCMSCSTVEQLREFLYNCDCCAVAPDMQVADAVDFVCNLQFDRLVGKCCLDFQPRKLLARFNMCVNVSRLDFLDFKTVEKLRTKLASFAPKYFVIPQFESVGEHVKSPLAYMMLTFFSLYSDLPTCYRDLFSYISHIDDPTTLSELHSLIRNSLIFRWYYSILSCKAPAELEQLVRAEPVSIKLTELSYIYAPIVIESSTPDENRLKSVAPSVDARGQKKKRRELQAEQEQRERRRVEIARTVQRRQRDIDSRYQKALIAYTNYQMLCRAGLGPFDARSIAHEMIFL